MWLKAEKFFNKISEARKEAEDVKIHLVDDVFLVSNIWKEDKNRYTGIHALNPLGSFRKHTGVNLTEQEWNTIVENFHHVKDCLDGKVVNLQECQQPEHVQDGVKMFQATWYVESKPYSSEQLPYYFFAEDSAKAAMHVKPEQGVDYESDKGEPELKVQCHVKSAPDGTVIMHLCLLQLLQINIDAEVKKMCDACQIDSESQKDHFQSGNCLDEGMDFTSLHFASAKSKITVFELMQLFDEVRRIIGANPVFSKQLAACAMSWLSDEQLIDELHNVEGKKSTPLMSVVRQAYYNLN